VNPARTAREIGRGARYAIRMDSEEGFREYRRELPHWRASGSVYHIVWRIHQRAVALAEDEREVIAGALHHFDGDRYELEAFVVMDDHVHIVVSVDRTRLERIVHSWKSFTAHALVGAGRASPVWQREYYDRIVRDEAEFHRLVAYVEYNPRERWPEIRDYPWSWVRIG
jgi:REP element-mobilizing transposase RayT